MSEIVLKRAGERLEIKLLLGVFRHYVEVTRLFNFHATAAENFAWALSRMRKENGHEDENVKVNAGTILNFPETENLLKELKKFEQLKHIFSSMS